MNCLNCSADFDPVHHIPRLLPHCGHTLCSVCISRLINSNFIICTQCQQLNMAFKQSDLPKNLAILRIQNESKRTIASQQPSSSLGSLVTNESNVRSIAPQQHPSTAPEQRCGKHNKKLQAFCLQCFEYVCLQCVISHPKEHQLKTLQQAVGYFKEQTKKIIKFYREMKLNYKMQRVELEKTDVLGTVNQYKARIAKIFGQIKNYLEQKETEAISTLRSLYDVEVNRLAAEQKELEGLLESYNKLVQISHANTLKACLDSFEENRGLLNYSKQKALFQMLAKRDKTAATPVRSELGHWQDSFNKFKERIAKDIKQMLQIRAELKQKPMGTYKNGASNSNIMKHSSNNSNNSKKDLQKFYKLDSSKRTQKQGNKQLHISLKELDKFVAQSTQNSRQVPMSSATATSRISIETTIIRCPLMMYGGFTEDEDSPAVEIYGHGNSLKTQRHAVGCGHVKFGIVGIGSKIYVFGGKRQNKRLSDIYVMDSLRSQMKEFGQMSKAKSGFGYCKKGTCCYVVGGNDGTILQDFEEYDFQTQEVRSLPKLTIARDQLTAVLHKNEIFAVGGYNLDNELSLSVVERYNFQNKKWTLSAPLVIQRRSHGSISLDSGLYVVGGYDGRNYLSTIERYNELECRWQIVCEMMEQRCTFGLAECHRSDGFFVFGGFAHQPLATCQLFLADTKKCTPVQPLQSKRFMLAAVQIPWDL